MKSIRTVVGDISPRALGHAQCHEHLLVGATPAAIKNPNLLFDERDKSLRELQQYRRDGGDALVDAQPVGAGRDADGLRMLAEATGLHIVASTGFHKKMFYPKGHWAFCWPREDLAAVFIRELCQGMFYRDSLSGPQAPGPARAGMIKMALDAQQDNHYEVLTDAALKASSATGAPILLHTDARTNPLTLLDKAAAQGIPMSKVAVCHLDRTCPDLKLHEDVARRGAYLEYDTIGRYKYHDDGRELEIIVHMEGRGFAGQILLSLDTTRARLASYGGSPSLSYLLTDFMPMLTKVIPAASINQITRVNPVRFLENDWHAI